MQTLFPWVMDLALWAVVYLMWKFEKPVINLFDSSWQLKPGQYSHNKMMWRVFYSGFAIIALLGLGYCCEQLAK